MTKETIDLILHCKLKGYTNDDDNKVIWATYEELWGNFPGCKSCGENIRDAVKKLVIYIQTHLQ